MWQADCVQGDMVQRAETMRSIVSPKRRPIERLDGTFTGRSETPWRYSRKAMVVRVRLEGAATAEVHTRIGGQRRVTKLGQVGTLLLRENPLACHQVVVMGEGSGFAELVNQ